jgi:hypothetical protein
MMAAFIGWLVAGVVLAAVFRAVNIFGNTEEED